MLVYFPTLERLSSFRKPKLRPANDELDPTFLELELAAAVEFRHHSYMKPNACLLCENEWL